MKIAELHATAAVTGTYDVTGPVNATELKAYLRAGKTVEFLNKRIAEQYGNVTFNNIKAELTWLKIS